VLVTREVVTANIDRLSDSYFLYKYHCDMGLDSLIGIRASSSVAQGVSIVVSAAMTHSVGINLKRVMNRFHPNKGAKKAALRALWA
jgi:hypothetical protein